MKRALISAVAAFVVTLVSPGAERIVHADEAASTTRHVHGIITGVDDAHLTIASMQTSVSGKLDPKRTKVTLNGKPAKLADLKLTAHAKGELCLDDIWVSIDAH